MSSITKKHTLHSAAEAGLADVCERLVRGGADVNERLASAPSRVTPLHVAAAANQRDVCRALIALGAGVALTDHMGLSLPEWRAPDESTAAVVGATPLHLAAWCGFSDVVIVLLAASSESVHAVGPLKRTPLHWAAAGCARVAADSAVKALPAAPDAATESPAVRCCRLLVKGGANLDARDAAGNSALLLAAECGAAPLCKALLALDASLDVTNESGATALHLAARNGHDEVVRLLLRECHDLAAATAAKDKLGQTPLHSAAIAGSALCVELLLASGASAALADARGLSPLHECTSRQVASLLLKAGAPLDGATLQGRTPLHIAALENRARIIKYLAEKACKIDARDADGATALHCAAFRGHLDSVAALLDAGARLDVADNAKLTPLHVAAFRGHTDVVKKLASAGADVNVPDDSGTTPLHGAAAGGHDKVVKALLGKAGAAVNCATKEGGTPLHFAAAANHAKVVALLLAHEAHVDATDLRSRTALQFAAHQGHADMCARLLKAGSNVATTDVDGNNALHVACLSDAHEAVAVLLEKAPAAAVRHARLARNSRIMTPLDVAKDCDAAECAALLAKAAAGDDDDSGSSDAAPAPVAEKKRPPPPAAAPAPSPPKSRPTESADKKPTKRANTLKNETKARDAPANGKATAKTDDAVVERKPKTRAPPPPAIVAATKAATSASATTTTSSSSAAAAAATVDDSKLLSLTNCIQGAKLVPLHRLAKALLEPDRKLVKALFKTTQLADADKLARGLIYLHERSGDSTALLQCAIDYEVASNDTAGTLFRANTLQSKLLTQYATLHGGGYLRDVLLAPIESVLKRAQALEIDPTRVELSGKLATSSDTKAQEAERRRVANENTTKLVATVRAFCEALFGSHGRVPEQLRFVCAELSSRVRAKFGDDQVPIIVGGYFFLRFVTPTVVTPEGPGQLVPASQVTKEARRTLVLLSKVLTQLANGVPKFGVREEFMAPLNDTLGSELGNMRSFIGRISSNAARRVDTAKLTDAQVVEAWNLLHERLAYDRERIEKALDADTFRSIGTVLAVVPKPPALADGDWVVKK